MSAIHDECFYDNTSITSVTIPSSVIIVGNYAFYGCSSLETVTFGEGVETIPRYMFYNVAAVKTVKISSSVTSIGYNAFNGCSSLTAVFYGGSAEEWTTLSNNVSGITYLTSATRYYYSETQSETSGNYWHYVDGVPTKW